LKELFRKIKKFFKLPGEISKGPAHGAEKGRGGVYGGTEDSQKRGAEGFEIDDGTRGGAEENV